MNTYKRAFVACLYLASMASMVCHAPDKDTASLIQQLEHADDDVHHSTYESLVEIGEAAVPALIVGLNHEKAKVRKRVVDILHGIRERVPHNKDIVRALVKALKDDDITVRDRALERFLFDSELPPEAISGLVQLLHYGSPYYGHWPVITVLLSGRDPQAQAALIEALHSSEWPLRFGTAIAYSAGDGRRQLRLEFPNKRNKEKLPSPGLKSIRPPYTGPPPPPGTTKAVVSTLVEGLTHPDWKTRELVMDYLDGFDDDFDEARQALAALPPFGIISQTIRDGDDVDTIHTHWDPGFLDSLNTEGITFKFNRSIYRSGKITISPFIETHDVVERTTKRVYGEPLGWNVEEGSHSITITPPEGKELVMSKGQHYQYYTIQLRDVQDILGNQVDAEIEFSTAVPLRRAP